MDELKTYEERYRALDEACKNFLKSHDTALMVMNDSVVMDEKTIEGLRNTIFEEIEKIRELVS